MRIHFLIHESFEGPGAFEHWAVDNRFHITRTKFYEGERLPEQLDFDFLVILGGPQSPKTSVSDCAHFNVIEEVRFIRECIALNKAIVGICLGAQLIGEALGAKYEVSPHKEIGYLPVTITAAGENNVLFDHFQSTEVVGHWHNDMPGLLPTSKILASSLGCPRQIVEYADLIYGFQCHLEFTQQCVESLIIASYDESLSSTHQWVQKATDILTFDTQHMNNLLSEFLDKLSLKYQRTHGD
ncbi:glutamine amidotransferase-related protein [Pseudoalteromonas aurantia]|uniref:GMP synthase (Glutamine-hydrolyzing) n=1 Tax=Pseudoalteromonas aurantia 208 TaxID=1314867 RepID=A0ABR9ECA7_9GAMM|nr:glutamine amidotransferase [Pseudoalteromonas aurantia]MBE0368631.1 GMP synthase (glutamine-hydrolyzing) [Pseudoalteromonas aurantia 208]